MAEYLTPDEVAEQCRATRRTVYDWLKEGKLRGRRAGKRWLIAPSDVEAFLNAGTAAASAPLPVEPLPVEQPSKLPPRVKSTAKPRRR